MAIRLTKPWVPIDEALSQLRGQMGVYQLADAQEQILYIGFAGGRSLFGLKGEVRNKAAEITAAKLVRVEVTTAYLSRFRELMMTFIADHGAPPSANPPVKLGRLSPD